MVPAAERSERLIVQARNAFFDESGTHDQSELITVGGLISSYDSWSRWELEWNSILASRKVKVFHFTDFMAQQGEFENDWKDRNKRDQFMERLCTTVSDNIVAAIVSSVFREDYERYVPEWLKRQVRDPYYFGLYTCLWQIVTIPQVIKKVTLPKPVEFLFDRKPHYEGFASDIFYAIKRQFQHLEWTHPVGDMGLETKQRILLCRPLTFWLGWSVAIRLKHWRKTGRIRIDDDDLDKAILALGKSGRL